MSEPHTPLNFVPFRSLESSSSIPLTAPRGCLVTAQQPGPLHLARVRANGSPDRCIGAGGVKRSLEVLVSQVSRLILSRCA